MSFCCDLQPSLIATTVAVAKGTPTTHTRTHTNSLCAQFFSDIVFSVFYMTVFDYLIAMFSCEFSDSLDAKHLYFHQKDVCECYVVRSVLGVCVCVCGGGGVCVGVCVRAL